MINVTANMWFPGEEGERVQPNFTTGEFKCKGGDWPWLLDHSLTLRLQTMRILLSKPIRINSGYRTPEYNAKIGGAKKSKHMLGLAADLDVPDGMSSIAFAGSLTQPDFAVSEYQLDSFT